MLGWLLVLHRHLLPIPLPSSQPTAIPFMQPIVIIDIPAAIPLGRAWSMGHHMQQLLMLSEMGNTPAELHFSPFRMLCQSSTVLQCHVSPGAHAEKRTGAE